MERGARSSRGMNDSVLTGKLVQGSGRPNTRIQRAGPHVEVDRAALTSDHSQTVLPPRSLRSI